MAEHDQNPKNKQKQQKQINKPKPVAADQDRRAARLDGAYDLLGLAREDGDTLQSQAARLSDPRLPAVQRQSLAIRIGRVQGNQHLQRVMSQVRAGGASASPPLVQRQGGHTTAERGGGTYEVVGGDTLWGIAEATYGHGRYWQAIYRANPGKAFNGGNLIYIGTILNLPVLQVTVSTEEAEADEGGSGAAVEPPGYGISTEFGDYWVVPDDTNQSFNVEGEQIIESEFAQLEQTWDALQNNTGSIQISETDDAHNDHAGFRDMVLTQFGKLLSQPVGRGLVTDLVSGTQTVTIKPSSARIYGGANATRGGAGTLENPDGTPGTGGTTTIRIDPGLQDDDVMVFDPAGNEIALPVFITLGHELIHAQHNAAGRNRRNLDETDPAYGNLEEEETIATGPLTENDLREEHSLPERHGHAGRDTRFP